MSCISGCALYESEPTANTKRLMTISTELIVTLQLIKGLGPAKLNAICESADGIGGDPLSLEDLFDMIGEMAEKKRLPRFTMPEFDDFRDANRKARNIMSRSRDMGIGVVSRYDEEFPKNLLGTVTEEGKPSVPTVLYYRGDLSAARKPALAVIGTREPTEAGRTAGKYYAKAFAKIGVNIVSGLALGCDTAGHRGALDAGGTTTAFLAHGLDSVYPQENEALAKEIVSKGGLLMSEYPIGTQVNRYNLVARDRLQAGLSDATLVVQTGEKGGTMHAVRATIAAGKPVFVIDYSADQGEKTAGNAMLKRQGAKGLRVSSDEIVGNPEKYTRMICGVDRENDGKETIQGTLF